MNLGLELGPAQAWNEVHGREQLLYFRRDDEIRLIAKVAERLRKCLQSITTPVRIRTLALEALKSDGYQEEFADT